jgi:serine protease Do
MKNLILGFVMAILAFSAGGFAVVYFQDHSTVNTLQNDMLSLEHTASVASSAQLAQTGNISDMIKKVNSSVVRIDTTGDGFAGVGSGFIVTNSGYVLTNQHVIDNALTVMVSLTDGKQYPATVVDDDPDRDLALLMITSTRKDFPAINLASAAEVTNGVPVMAVGFPLGLELIGPPSYTSGIVSAIRNMSDYKYIQTDAAINPGNSGGPLIDYQGEVVGICTANITDPNINVQGMGLAIPIQDALGFMANGKVECSSCHGSKLNNG